MSRLRMTKGYPSSEVLDEVGAHFSEPGTMSSRGLDVSRNKLHMFAGPRDLMTYCILLLISF